MTGHVAAVDLGATSGRVIVGRVGPDELQLTQVARFANDPVRTPDGLHWNTLGLYGAALAGLRTAFRETPGILSIGVDSWGVDYALLRSGRLLGQPFHYRDDRMEAGVDRVHGTITRADLFARNGLQFMPINTVYQLASEPVEVLDLADTVLLTPDLFNYWLTGIMRAETTIASTTGLLSVDGSGWDDGLLRMLGLPRDLLPELIDPGQRVGSLRADVAQSLGAGDAVVTAVGSHDTASAVVAVPMDPTSAAYISCGTWGLVGVEVAAPVVSAEAIAANFTNEGGVDGRTRLLHNVMGLWVLSETVRAWERSSGEAIDLPGLLHAASAVPASSVPVFDVDDPRFLAPGDMTARIDAWCEEHGVAAPQGRAAYARSIVESLAQAFADAVGDAARLGSVDVRTIHIVGGGALNELLCQRTADRAGLTVIAGPVEATALGNILVQARAVGLLNGDLAALRDLVARTHEPRRYDPR